MLNSVVTSLQNVAESDHAKHYNSPFKIIRALYYH